MFNKSFYHFLFAFAAILAVAFGVLVFTGLQIKPDPIDNLAQPQ